MSQHAVHSSYREKLIEHLFVGELLKMSWQDGDCQLEIAKPEVDNSGYDIIAEGNGIVRHIQLKAAYIGSKITRQKVHIKLSQKPSGCVVWIYFNKNSLELGPFYYFGGLPGEPLPNIQNAKVARHTKGDQGGYKGERANIRVLNKGDFKKYDDIKEIYSIFFGNNA